MSDPNPLSRNLHVGLALYVSFVFIQSLFFKTATEDFELVVIIGKLHRYTCSRDGIL